MQNNIHTSTTPSPRRAPWIAGISVALFVGTGCDLPAQDGREPEETVPQPIDTQRNAPTHEAIEKALNVYIDAIQTRDADAVGRILSSEMLARLDSDGDGESDTDELQDFVESEADKLTASLAGNLSDRRFTLDRLELSVDGATAEAWLTYAGVALPKPQFLVQEDGVWKYGDPARQQARAASMYVVKNQTASNKTVSCSGGSKKTPGGYATIQINCSNVCGIFSGTQFTYIGGQYYCDYNTWGTDFTLYSGYGVCTGNC